MPCCKNCGARLSKLDKDICPVCGTKNPLEGVTSETIEITSQLQVDSKEFALYKPCSRMVAFILSCLLGVFGAPFFYIRKSKAGFISLAVNIVVIVILILVFMFGIKLSLALSIILPIVIAYTLNIVIGLFFLFKRDLKDGRGEFLR